MLQCISKVIRSFGFAFAGIKYVITTQRNMKIHVAAAMIVLVLGYIVKLSATEWMLLILTIAGVWAAELFNTALETLVDLVSPERHPLAKISKDAAAGAVLCMALAAVAVGYFLFVVKFL